MEISMLPRKMLNIIVFCKAQQNTYFTYALKSTKPEPMYAYKRHASKKTCSFSFLQFRA